MNAIGRLMSGVRSSNPALPVSVACFPVKKPFTASIAPCVEVRRGQRVQMAERDGRKKSPVAGASNEGVASHLPLSRALSCAQRSVRAADAACRDRLLLARSSTSRRSPGALACRRTGAPGGWTWRLGDGRENGLPATFRTPAAPYRERAFAWVPVSAVCAASRLAASAGMFGTRAPTRMRAGTALA